jgi:uncharacterized protein (DUF342 family)
MSQDKDPVALPAVAFSLSVNLDGTKENFNNLVVQTHLPLHYTESEINVQLDKLFNVVERRKLHYRLEQLERSLSEHEAFVTNAKADLHRLHNQHQEMHIASGKPGKYKPNRQEAQAIQMAKNNVDNAETSIKRIQTQIKVTRQKLGIDLRTDS